MALQISGMDLYYLTKEFKALEGGKIDKIYHPEKKELLFNLHKSGLGKVILRIRLPNFIYLSEKKFSTPDEPTGFCMFLRKKLKNSRIRLIEQIGIERILKITFSTKDHEYILFIELFSKGNLILCDKDLTILQPLEWQMWKDRKVKTKAVYELPKARFNPADLTIEKLNEMLNNSTKEKLVTFLAIELGLGGKYSEYVCEKSGLKKDSIPSEIDETEKLLKQILRLFNKSISPAIKYIDDKPVSVFPFADHDDFILYNEIFDKFFENDTTAFTDKPKESKKVRKLKEIIRNQNEHITTLEGDIIKNNELGELIYSNYQVVNEIITQFQTAMKTMTVQEIKKKIKNPIIKDINPKEKKLTLILDQPES